MPLRKILENIILDKELMLKVKFLEKLKIFEGLNYRSLAKIYQIMHTKTYQPDDDVFMEGEVGRAIFIIKSGEVSLYKSGKPLAKLKEGEFFGEMALLVENPRTATAKASAVSEIGFIYKAAFDSLIENDPRLGLKVIYNLASMISMRLRETSEQYVKNI